MQKRSIRLRRRLNRHRTISNCSTIAALTQRFLRFWTHSSLVAATTTPGCWANPQPHNTCRTLRMGARSPIRRTDSDLGCGTTAHPLPTTPSHLPDTRHDFSSPSILVTRLGVQPLYWPDPLHLLVPVISLPGLRGHRSPFPSESAPVEVKSRIRGHREICRLDVCRKGRFASSCHSPEILHNRITFPAFDYL